MLVELVEDGIELAFIVVCLYLTLSAYVHRRRPESSARLERRRVTILFALLLLTSAIKVTEDVLHSESGPTDEAILIFVHSHVSRAQTSFFEAATITGSARFLLPLSIVATVALLVAKRRFEAWLLAGSVSGAAMLVYLIKAAVGRARPALWDTEWYWGSSFPSGHTLVVAAFATAAAVCVSRIRPAVRGIAFAMALLWILVVALSRVVLGVHWPTDVVVAACLGASLPLAVSVATDLLRA